MIGFDDMLIVARISRSNQMIFLVCEDIALLIDGLITVRIIMMAPKKD